MSLTIDTLFKEKSNPKQHLELLLVLKAWSELKLKEEMSFVGFKNSEISLSSIANYFEALKEEHEVFKLYDFPKSAFTIDAIKNLIECLNVNDFPSVNQALFYLLNKEYLTSYEVARLCVKLLDDNVKEIYLPFSTNFAITDFTDAKILSENSSSYLEFIALLINIIDKKEIEYHKTTLENPAYVENEKLKQFDNVICFPSINLLSQHIIDKYERFNFPIKRSLDLAFFEHAIAQTEKKAIVLMPMGFTFRGSVEEDFRKYLIDKNIVEAVITLPAHIHCGTTIGTVLIVINKHKKDKDTVFMDLRHEQFITKISRKLRLCNIDKIEKLFKQKQELEGVLKKVSHEEIKKNQYSFAADRYFIEDELSQLNQSLSKYTLVNLTQIAEIKKSQQVKEEDTGVELYEILQSDFSHAGYTTKAKRFKKNDSQISRVNAYQLQAYDVVLSVKGYVGKVALIGEINETIVPAQTLLIIRLKSKKDLKNNAIALYMFFKSVTGQTLLKSVTAGNNIPQIPTASLKTIKVPIFDETMLITLEKNFKKEQELFESINSIKNEIKQLHAQI